MTHVGFMTSCGVATAPAEDCSQEQVTVFLPHATRPKDLGARLAFVIDLVGDDIVGVHHVSPDWKHVLREQGYDRFESWVEGYVEGLARRAYHKRQGR